MEISKEEAKKLIKGSGGQFVSVEFIKKNGDVRKLNGRMGVHSSKYAPLKNVGLAYDPDEYGLIGIFDAQNKGYRMVNINTLLGMKIDGKEYQIKAEEIK
jgi:hypothetical protein